MVKAFALLCSLLMCLPAWAGRALNGSTDFITVNGTTSVDLPTGPLTVSLWIFPNNVDALSHTIVGKWGSSGPQQQYIIGLGGPHEAGQNAGFEVGADSTLSGVYNACGPLTSGHWYRVTLNGTPTSSAGVTVGGFVSCSAGFPFNERRAASGNITSLIFGQDNATRFFNGTICDAAIWNANLSAAEIASLASGVAANKVRTTALKYYAPMYGISSPEPDLSGNVLSGVLTGTSAAPHCPVGPNN